MHFRPTPRLGFVIPESARMATASKTDSHSPKQMDGIIAATATDQECRLPSKCMADRCPRHICADLTLAACPHLQSNNTRTPAHESTAASSPYMMK